MTLEKNNANCAVMSFANSDSNHNSYNQCKYVNIYLTKFESLARTLQNRGTRETTSNTLKGGISCLHYPFTASPSRAALRSDVQRRLKPRRQPLLCPCRCGPTARATVRAACRDTRSKTLASGSRAQATPQRRAQSRRRAHVCPARAIHGPVRPTHNAALFRGGERSTGSPDERRARSAPPETGVGQAAQNSHQRTRPVTTHLMRRL